mmetsp:Transcript_6345/g.14072  ORF Transcript_6345/g.14072 Transcript_6345/m.14072 type:complete len:124 (+) Transcript_6345:427-798(+)
MHLRQPWQRAAPAPRQRQDRTRPRRALTRATAGPTQAAAVAAPWGSVVETAAAVMAEAQTVAVALVEVMEEAVWAAEEREASGAATAERAAGTAAAAVPEVELLVALWEVVTRAVAAARATAA